MEHFISQLLKLRNRHFLAIDMLIFLVTPSVALTLRTDELGFPTAYLGQLFVITLVFMAAKLVIFLPSRLYGRFWRYASLDELAQILGKGNSVVTVHAQKLANLGALSFLPNPDNRLLKAPRVTVAGEIMLAAEESLVTRSPDGAGGRILDRD